MIGGCQAFNQDISSWDVKDCIHYNINALIRRRLNTKRLKIKRLNRKYFKIIKKIQRNHVPISSKALEKACGSSTENIKILVESGYLLSSKSLEIACGFSTNAVKILVEAGCPLSSNCLKIARGFSTDSIKIIVNYRFKLIIKKISLLIELLHNLLCRKKNIEYFVKNTKLDNDVLMIINNYYSYI